MQSKDVVKLVQLLEANKIDVWLDGGWAVDALLGKQTREHEDLDIVLQEKDLSKLRELLEAEGYKDVPRDDTRPENFVLGDDKGNLVDVHAFRFDEEGDGIYGNKGAIFPVEAFKGIGMIFGQSVKCIAPEQVVKFHTGYEPPEKHIKDVTALCEKFGIELPKAYKQIKADAF